MSKRRWNFIILAAILLLLTACSSGGQVMDGEDMVRSYTQISQEEAKQMMEQDGTQIIVDVRTQEEYDSGHIPGAICIPNESIGTEHPEELPDLDQVILVYCRSGNRSKQAAQKLFDMGYINVYEFGGINDWTGEVVTETPDTDASQESVHESEIADISQESEPESQMTDEEKTDMKLKIGDTEVPVIWEENESVDALKALAAEGPLTIHMSMYGGFEQVGPIGQDIVSNDQQTTTQAGDIVLYSGDQIVAFYGSNSWAYTRLGHADLSQKEMEDLLGNGDVIMTLQMED
ncbi:MAG: cyclophilin-like fold protein [Roseburia faecis]|jgi:rhodanese-related sulfurtransferase|nr:cyclophilin-like fold protein [Roseburia faecis]MDY6307979.1 cyclophilin-like fold protein [Oribacterium sp.]